MRSFARVLTVGAVLLLGVLVALLGLAPPASAAHAKLASTTPAAGANVTTAPGAVRLLFTGNVISLGLQLQVIGPTGLVTSGKAVVDRTTVTQPLTPGLVNGAYVVNWHVVHDDGHPDSGTFSFGIAVPGGPTTAPGQAPVKVAPLPDAAVPPEGLPAGWIVAGLALIVVTLVIAVVADRRRRRTAGPSKIAS